MQIFNITDPAQAQINDWNAHRVTFEEAERVMDHPELTASAARTYRTYSEDHRLLAPSEKVMY